MVNCFWYHLFLASRDLRADMHVTKLLPDQVPDAMDRYHLEKRDPQELQEWEVQFGTFTPHDMSSKTYISSTYIRYVNTYGAYTL